MGRVVAPVVVLMVMLVAGVHAFDVSPCNAHHVDRIQVVQFWARVDDLEPLRPHSFQRIHARDSSPRLPETACKTRCQFRLRLGK